MPLHHMQLRRARKAAAGVEERATSRLASRKRLCRFSGLFNHRNSHCVQRDEETFAYFLLAAAIDGNRSTTGWVVVSPRRDLVRRRLPLAAAASRQSRRSGHHNFLADMDLLPAGLFDGGRRLRRGRASRLYLVSIRASLRASRSR
jgi:hypothetical protein